MSDPKNSNGILGTREGVYADQYAQAATKLGLFYNFAFDLLDSPYHELLTKKQRRRLRKLLAIVESLKSLNRQHKQEVRGE